MRVRLKGIHTVKKRLASGEVQTYYYAWRGGPRLSGAPGSREFIASFSAAIESRKTPDPRNLKALIVGYRKSTDFQKLSARTKADYSRQIIKVEEKFGEYPIAGLSDPRTRGIFMAWRDELATASPRQADYAWTVLALILAWAKDRRLILENPCERGGRVYQADRSDKIWTLEQEAAFMASAGGHLRIALQLALWTGQRQGDLLALPWSAYEGGVIKLKQGKTGARMVIPVGEPLKVMLDAWPRRARTILVNGDGEPWTADGFRSSWRKACIKAGVTGVTFHDLRGTAITRLALVECTVAEIATLTGHSLRDVEVILDTHYLSRDVALAQSAIRKLEISRASQ